MQNSVQQKRGAARDDCLIVYKFPQRWHWHLEKKLSQAFRIHRLYAREALLESGSVGLVKEINDIVQKTSAKIVMFDTDYFAAVDADVIRSVSPGAIRVLMTFDDLVLHDHNAITASACDLVFTSDPVSALRYREKGIDAEYMTLEASKDVYTAKDLRRDIDILFFGSLKKADRKLYVDYLVNHGLEVCVIGGEHGEVSMEELVDYINRSKIVLNLSKTGAIPDALYGQTHYSHTYYQLKGRVIEAGLCATPCLSEYAPSLELLFTESEVPMFRTPEECFAKATELLKSETLRLGYASRLHDKVMRCYEDSAQMPLLLEAVSRARRCDMSTGTVPVNYWRSAFGARVWLLARRPLVAIREVLHFLARGPARPTIRVALCLEQLVRLPARLWRRMVGPERVVERS